VSVRVRRCGWGGGGAGALFAPHATSRRCVARRDPLLFFVSPYERTRGTFRCLLRGLSPLAGDLTSAPTSPGSGGGCASLAGRRTRIVGVREEPRLREMDFGNWQVPEQVELALKSRDKFSKVSAAHGELAVEVKHCPPSCSPSCAPRAVLLPHAVW
jgi:hypothetical protein